MNKEQIKNRISEIKDEKRAIRADIKNGCSYERDEIYNLKK